MYKVLLINPPFANLETPSLGLTQLKSIGEIKGSDTFILSINNYKAKNIDLKSV